MKKYVISTLILLFCIAFVSASEWEQLSKIVASDRGANDYFGYSLAISDNFAIVGSYREDHNASGVDSLHDAGAAYIFTKSEGAWIPMQKLVASDRAENDEFGCSVAISGNYAIVGAQNQDTDENNLNPSTDAGAAYIFFFNGSAWVQEQKIVASNHQPHRFIGHSVSISGNYAILGSHRDDEDANEENMITDAGAAYIFYRNELSWVQQQKIVASDRSSYDNVGNAVSISGNYALVGAWQQNTDLNGVNAISGAGAAYIFTRNGSTWTQAQKIIASDREVSDHFGCSVAISNDHIIVGAYGDNEDQNGANTLLSSGSAYIFERAANTWSQKQKIVAADRSESSWFGYSVAISGNNAIVGALRELYNRGAAYIFSRNESSWIQEAKLTASVRAGNDNFGCSVAMSDDYAFVGALNEYEDENNENTLQNAGAAYIFKLTNSDTTSIQDLTIPKFFTLKNIYPNPFNPQTTISLNYIENCYTAIQIYNTQGKLLKTLYAGQIKAGDHDLVWHAGDMPSGIYIVKVQSNNIVLSQKIALIK